MVMELDIFVAAVVTLSGEDCRRVFGMVMSCALMCSNKAPVNGGCDVLGRNGHC